jgi:hypothetical protein
MVIIFRLTLLTAKACVQVRHLLEGLVRDRPVFTLGLNDFPAKPLLAVRVLGQLVEGVAQGGRGGLEAGQDEDEGLGCEQLVREF